MTKQYQTGIVRGLKDYLDVLGIISGENNRLPKCKYHQRPGIVSFMVGGGVDISSIIGRLEEKGLSTKEILQNENI